MKRTSRFTTKRSGFSNIDKNRWHSFSLSFLGDTKIWNMRLGLLLSTTDSSAKAKPDDPNEVWVITTKYHKNTWSGNKIAPISDTFLSPHSTVGILNTSIVWLNPGPKVPLNIDKNRWQSFDFCWEVKKICNTWRIKKTLLGVERWSLGSLRHHTHTHGNFAAQILTLTDVS